MKRKPLSKLTPRAAEQRGFQRGIAICQGAIQMKQYLVEAYREAWKDAYVLIPPEREHLLRFEGDPPRRKTFKR